MLFSTVQISTLLAILWFRLLLHAATPPTEPALHRPFLVRDNRISLAMRTNLFVQAGGTAAVAIHLFDSFLSRAIFVAFTALTRSSLMSTTF